MIWSPFEVGGGEGQVGGGVSPGRAGSAAASAPGEWRRSRGAGSVSAGSGGRGAPGAQRSPPRGSCCSGPRGRGAPSGAAGGNYK